ncbi:MAG: glycosyl hydrolase family 25 [Prevotella sp.]|nr:glycosyl hydrolase family 25 [Prevotella sp.]
MMCAGDALAKKPKHPQRRTRQKTHKVVKNKKKKVVAKKPVEKFVPLPAVRDIEDDAYNPFLQCEDTCNHVHGIDLSRYQGDVFWETVGENTKMAYVYLKATEGGDRIDPKFERNIELAHRYGLKVGSYHFFRPKTPLQKQLENFTAQCLPGEQDLIPMIDVETTGGMPSNQFCDSLMTFLYMVEKHYKQKPLVYTFRNFYNWHLVGRLNDYQLMVAMYLDEEPVLADERDITLWQYTGKGRIVGINGYVDKSRFLGRHGLREIRFRH